MTHDEGKQAFYTPQQWKSQQPIREQNTPTEISWKPRASMTACLPWVHQERQWETMGMVYKQQQDTNTKLHTKWPPASWWTPHTETNTGQMGDKWMKQNECELQGDRKNRID